jgi:hypothetical protein
MMCALLSPVIILITAYLRGIAFGAPLEIYKIAQPLLLISLLLWIPTGIIVFLLIADRKLMQHLEHRQLFEDFISVLQLERIENEFNSTNVYT